jgi:hypothetical protein
MCLWLVKSVNSVLDYSHAVLCRLRALSLVAKIVDGLDQVYEALIDIKAAGNVTGFQPQTRGCHFKYVVAVVFGCMAVWLVSHLLVQKFEHQSVCRHCTIPTYGLCNVFVRCSIYPLSSPVPTLLQHI